ncbi:MAG: hypothetical protein Fur0041_00150 [Bacteroidia bacterium]
MKQHHTLVWKIWAILILTFIQANNEAYASHAQGADLTYTCLGGNQYRLRLSFYRDCSGSQAPGSVNIDISSVSCNQNFSTTLYPITNTGQDVTPICPSLTTVCNGGNYPGVQEWIYEGTINLPAACADWVFSFDFCCRNNAINTIVNPGGQNIYIESHLDNLNAPCNNSPTFSNRPIPFVCIGQNYCFNHGAVDPDGDSLAYSLVPPQNSATSTVTYITPYSALQPVPSSPAMTFNPATGDICMTPTQIIVTVMAVRVEEWRNGIMIGSVVRDIQLKTVTCSNTNPYTTGINNTNQYSISGCAGFPISFNILSGDPDAGQNVTMTWNNAIPGATFTTGPGPLPVGTFTWTPNTSNISNTPYCFTITVTDDACPYAGSQTYAFCITITGLGINVTSTGTNCGASNGSASVTVTGGTGPFSYQWLPSGGNNANANGLTAGNYTVNVTDATGCTAAASVVVTQGPAPGNIQTSVVDIACFGQNTGSATVNVNGGQQPYTYAWSNGGNTPTINNLAAGTYSVQVTTANGCITTATITITQPASALSSQISSSSNILCFGQSTGSATVSASGGTAPYSYSWNTTPVQATVTATALAAGNYSVMITDANGCTSTSQVAITQPSALAGLITSSPVTCFGGTNGSASVAVNGGVGPYSVSWNSTPVQTGLNAVNLPAGTYIATITDANGCAIYPAVNLTQPPALTASITSSAPVSCFGGNNGSATVAAAGGTAPYTYSWNSVPAQNQATANGMTSGNYTVTVTDANGCATIGTVSITQPTQVMIVATGNDTVCLGQPVQIAASASGGNGGYTYNWSQNLGNNSTYTVYPSSLTTYSVYATDANGCNSAATSVTIDVFQFTPANLTVSPSTAVCSGNTAVVSAAVTGNTGPLTWNWTNNLGNTPGPFNVTPNSTTNYVVTVTNVCGVVVTGTVNVTVNPVPVISIDPVSITGCSRASAQFADSNAVNGNVYHWDFGDNSYGTGSSVTHDYFVSGTYTVVVVGTNSFGCNSSASTTAMVTVYDNPVAQFTTDDDEVSIMEPTVEFTDQSSANTISWMWDFGDNATSNLQHPVHTYAAKGTYNVRLIATATGGCTDTITQDVIVNPEFTLYIPNAFTPNGDGKNDFYFAYGEEITDFTMQIFDRWGNLIYTANSISDGWDGRANGGSEAAQQDVYVYKVNVKDYTGKQHKLTGHVSLLR